MNQAGNHSNASRKRKPNQPGDELETMRKLSKPSAVDKSSDNNRLVSNVEAVQVVVSPEGRQVTSIPQRPPPPVPGSKDSEKDKVSL